MFELVPSRTNRLEHSFYPTAIMCFNVAKNQKVTKLLNEICTELVYALNREKILISLYL